MSKLNEFNKMGGRASLIKINKIFYDKVYKHPWLKLFFEKIPQQHIEDQQVDFMQKVLGGPNIYVGKAPPAAHMHIFINEEIFELRQKLLQEAFVEANTDSVLVDKWLALDKSFKRVLLKDSPSDCQGRFTTDPVMNFSDPSSNQKNNS